MVCHRVQPGTPAISYKLITTTTFNRTTVGLKLWTLAWIGVFCLALF